MTESKGDTPITPRPQLTRRIGGLLILLSGLFFFTMISVPWWPLSSGQKAMVGGALFVSVQVAWWVGAAMVGPAAISAVRSWFSRKQT
jgi:hypothetical protein